MSEINLEPTDKKWRDEQRLKIIKVCAENNLAYEESTDSITVKMPLFKPVSIDIFRPPAPKESV